MYRGFRGSAGKISLMKALFDVRGCSSTANFTSMATKASRRSAMRAAVKSAAASSGRAQSSMSGPVLSIAAVNALVMGGSVFNAPKTGDRDNNNSVGGSEETALEGALASLRPSGSVGSSLTVVAAEEDGEAARRCRLAPCSL